jgi:acetoin:2,6-dichlorophenolindophenol oxidoreductase subunit alpha
MVQKAAPQRTSPPPSSLASGTGVAWRAATVRQGDERLRVHQKRSARAGAMAGAGSVAVSDLSSAPGSTPAPTVHDESTLQALLATMWVIRAFEERVSELYAEREIAGLLHLGIGQEAVAAGSASVLRREDVVYGGHRAHAHAIAKGADLTRLLAELAGRASGYCGGKGGSMHLSAPEVGFITATGVVAGNIPLALGAATVCRQRARGDVSVAFFGDGAAQTGSFHESLNIASLWQLPLVLVCENNGWAEFSPLSAHTPVARLASHAETYDIPTQTIDGNDVLAVREAVADAVARARDGDGPTFVECLTQRLRGHYEGDPGAYRELSALAEWQEKDPIKRFQRALADLALAVDVARFELEARERVEAAAGDALAAPWPTHDDLFAQVYAGG